jgi:hypothetical protein
MDDPPGASGEMGRAGRQRLDGVGRRVGQDLTGLSQELREGDRPQPHAATAQEITAGQKRVFEPGGMMGHGHGVYCSTISIPMLPGASVAVKAPFRTANLYRLV